MANFLRRLLGGDPPSPPFDVESEVSKLLAALPPCAARVVVASPRYSGGYRCEVTVAAKDLAPFVEGLAKSTFGGSRQSQVGRAAFPRWLRSAGTVGTSTSYLPSSFVDVVSSYVLNFVNDGSATVYCPDCKTPVQINQQTRNHQVSGPWSEWTDGWHCQRGHLLYAEDHELHILRRREP